MLCRRCRLGEFGKTEQELPHFPLDDRRLARRGILLVDIDDHHCDVRSEDEKLIRRVEPRADPRAQREKIILRQRAHDSLLDPRDSGLGLIQCRVCRQVELHDQPVGKIARE